MQKISILGCGWLGVQMAQTFIQAGYQVKGSRTSEAGCQELEKIGIPAEKVLLTNLKPIQQYELFFDTDILIIAISPSSFNGKYLYHDAINSILKIIKNNVHIVFISSTSVYADDNNEKFETSATTGISRNSSSIILSEQLITSQIKNKYSIIRPAGLIGKGRYPGKFFAGRKNIANGLAPVNLICGEDVCGIILKLIQQKKWNSIYNACAPDHPTKKDFYSKAAELIGLEKPDFSETKNEFKLINGDKVQKELNYQFIYPDLMAWLSFSNNIPGMVS